MATSNYRIEYLAEGILTIDYETNKLEAQQRCAALLALGYEPVLYEILRLF